MMSTDSTMSLKKHDRDENGRTRAISFGVRFSVVFWLIAAVLYAISLLDIGSIFGVIELVGERRVSEQMSKFFLLLGLLFATGGYLAKTLPAEVGAAVAFLLLCFVMYLAESNMIRNIPQLLFAIVLLPYIFVMLLKTNGIVSASILLFACIVLGLGVAIDLVNDYHAGDLPALFFNAAPEWLLTMLDLEEERYDPIGAALVSFSVAAYSLDQLKSIYSTNRWAALSIFAAAALIASGNSFLHWAVGPGQKAVVGALVFCFLGLAVLVVSVARINREHYLIGLPEQRDLFALILFFFVVLPSVFSRANNILSVLLWGPTIFLIAVALWRNHPKMNRSTRVNDE